MDNERRQTNPLDFHRCGNNPLLSKISLGSYDEHLLQNLEHSLPKSNKKQSCHQGYFVHAFHLQTQKFAEQTQIIDIVRNLQGKF